MTKPQIPKKTFQINDFSVYVKDYLLDESPVSSIEIHSEQMKDMDFFKLEIRASVFQNCTFHYCRFEDASFIDVVFESCDFSNSKFAGAYFERCQFVRCKCVGVDMQNTRIKQTAFEQSNFQYSIFDKAKMTEVLFDCTDCTESSIAEATLKKFEAKGSRFIKNNFINTMLGTIDFSDNEFTMPTVSSPPVELKGVTVNMFQAADLIGYWGVIVKQE